MINIPIIIPDMKFIISSLILGTVLFIISFPIVALILFIIHLKRTKKDKWSRNCSNDEQAQNDMYDIGMEWYKQHKDKKIDVHIINDGLNLYGEYYDFGFDRAVIVVPGRTESLRYGYYFAKPYVENGYNLLTIDQRAHGESDGKFNTVGIEEHRDIIAWAELLHNDYGIRSIVLHGICIGSATSLFAVTMKHCPDYLDAVIAEGMYPTFYDNFKNHIVALRKPAFPTMIFVNMWMKLYTGHSMKQGPIQVIHKYKKPLLMIHSEEDKYSLPSTAKTLFNAANSDIKDICWFKKGSHSQLRIEDTEKYDCAIADFLAKIDTRNVPEKTVASKPDSSTLPSSSDDIHDHCSENDGSSN